MPHDARAVLRGPQVVATGRFHGDRALAVIAGHVPTGRAPATLRREWVAHGRSVKTVKTSPQLASIVFTTTERMAAQ